ncbi:lipoma-preferred partner isoform X2 [Mixophyes fleayi]|uniref:lipoma-preferred partner isoform X2 n=1 Tax=Mixophyes fleayi TaxID=3061075 RepID=UPI003F4E0BE4
MSHPSWLPPKSSGDSQGHVSARMETTQGFGTPSISVSTHQNPKKFAPVVAPKPKYNPYRGGQSEGGDGDFPPPPPPPPEDTSSLQHTPTLGNFPPPPAPDEAMFNVQINTGGKTIEERRSSLDAEIDSLTSILADLESSSPYKPRTSQGSGSTTGTLTHPSAGTPVTGHKRMIIPNQPPLTATKKSAAKPQPQSTSQPAPAGSPGAQRPQPVPASYATASTPSRPTFNVQVKSAQPSSHFVPPGPQPGQPYSVAPNQYYAPQKSTIPREPEYIPPQPVRYADPSYGYPQGNQVKYQDPYYPATQGFGGRNNSEVPYAHQGGWKPEPAYTSAPAMGQQPPGAYPPPNSKKTYITDPPYAPPPPPQPKHTLEQCNVCAKPIMERILRATGKAYHPQCFICVVCFRSLDGIPFTVDASGHIHCIEDFHKKFAPRCSVCKEPIMPAPGQEETVRIVALDRDFHVQCYRCEDCGSLLSEGENQGCYPLDGHILCKSCNAIRIQALTAKSSTDL